METVLITGGTGLVGSALQERLKDEGYNIAVLSRNPKSKNEYRWDIKNGEIDEKALLQADHIVHLAGAGIADKRWTSKRKEELYISRVGSTALLYNKLKLTDHHVKTFISTSAIGYYGNRKSEWLKEDSQPGKGFLSSLCVDWEDQAKKISGLGIRTAITRFGIVLSENGGALAKMAMSVPFGVAPYLGDGKQFYSWIHIDDVCGIIIHLLKNKNLQGTYNTVAPDPVTNKALMKAIVKARNSNALVIGTPEFSLKLAMGEMSAAVLDSQRCSADKIQQDGYQFKFPQIDEALEAIYR